MIVFYFCLTYFFIIGLTLIDAAITLKPKSPKISTITAAAAAPQKRSFLRSYEVATKDYILVFGDSITEYGGLPDGFVTKLVEAYKDKLDVIDLGYGGHNAQNARSEALPSTIPHYNPANKTAPSPRLIIVEFGTNDSIIEGFKGHLPLPKYVENLRAIYDDFMNPKSPYYAPRGKVMFVTPGPLGLRMWNNNRGFDTEDTPVERDNDRVILYGETLKALAKKLDNAPVADFYSSMSEAIKWLPDVYKQTKYKGFEHYFKDGVHLNPEGNVVMFETIMNTIKREMPELLPENL
ncbi:isoamyl acetate-hydrolyzing esterase [Mycoemilia scoparia]|uniref:Isoamyl acetate-hydrolyzing esterase n=1 Tax=Mycoemilia scoparia TaxID=417184 RepID=A0A9W8DRG4_9FUNG|nr:isoamyl acetate-hydrolyzing esterase [Mycoemilia scoparia]